MMQKAKEEEEARQARKKAAKAKEEEEARLAKKRAKKADKKKKAKEVKRQKKALQPHGTNWAKDKVFFFFVFIICFFSDIISYFGITYSE